MDHAEIRAAIPGRSGMGYVAAALAVGTATGVCWLLFPHVERANLIMVYLVTVMLLAARYGRGPSVAASLGGVAAFDFFFVPPYLTLAVADTHSVVTFGVMLLAGLVIGTLTARIREQAAAARRREALVRAERLRNTLLTSISHDLRTPLATITGAATTVLESGARLTPDVQRELIESVRDEAERLSRLVHALHDITRLESGALQLRREWHPVEEVVGAALGRVARRLDGRKVTVDLAQELPLVEMDDVLVEQLLVNLLENVVEHTPADAPVRVSATADARAITVRVEDAGPGLPPEERERVFDKFHRLAPRGQRGAGLGLAICRGVAEAHGGRIWADNLPAGGAVFAFALPRTGGPPPAGPPDA